MFKAGDRLIATERYDGKFLYKGIISEVDSTDPKKVKILTGPGKGRRVLFDATKMEIFEGEVIDNEPKAKFQKHARVTVLSLDQFEIMGKSASGDTYFGDGLKTVAGCSAVVTSVVDFDAEAGCFQLEIILKDGEYESCAVYMLESELHEYYDKQKKFRISFLDDNDEHHTRLVEADSLEQARTKVGPIKQEFYHMAL